MDPARSERPASDALTLAERDARIEQLLLAGLDHYFVHDYDQAINLWTRVLFLDRHHDRARAYIERARSALAERQRESEALMHQGLEAFDRGDVEGARKLVDDALERGASRDLALGVLNRIDRLGAPPAPPAAARPSWLRPRRGLRQLAVPATLSRDRARGASILSAGATLLLLAAVLGAVAVGVWGVTLPDLSGWIGGGAGDARRAAPLTLAVDPLPLPSATELYLTRGRALFAAGRLHDALRELDLIPSDDTLRADADRLRGDIQRQLLAAAAVDPRPTNEVP